MAALKVEMKKIVWKTPATIKKLRNFLRAFVEVTKLSPEDIAQELEEAERNPKLRLASRALRNFWDGNTEKPSKTNGLDTLTRWLVRYVEDQSVETLRAHPDFADIKKLAATIGATNANGRPVSPQDLSAAMQLVASLLRSDQADFLRLERRLFRPIDERPDRNRFERHFICYRYHSTPGYVVKSFLAVMGRSEDEPNICRFLHFSEGTSGGKRMSAGVILPFQNATYFLGHAGDGEGLKIIAIRSFAPTKPVQEGIVLSFDDDSSLVASRIILVDTTCPNSQSADIGVLRDSDLQAEVAKYRPRLRNMVEFNLAEMIRFDGKPIDQQAMVVAVANALKDDEGNPRLTDRNGNAFNPAAKRHYTYNSALKIWSDNEDGP